jgi:hypothetical protein
MSKAVDIAQRRLDLADKWVKASKYVFATYLVLVTALIAVQQFQIQQNQTTAYKQAQDSLNRSLADSRAQQRKTQDYVKCVANALLIPLAQRSTAVFDKCGIETTGSAAQASPAASSDPVTQTKPASSEQAPTVQQPTTSAPPDPQQGQSSIGNDASTTPPGSGLIKTITSLPIVGPILLAI